MSPFGLLFDKSAAGAVLQELGGLLRVLRDLLRRREHPLLHLVAPERLRRARVERPLRPRDRRLPLRRPDYFVTRMV